MKLLLLFVIAFSGAVHASRPLSEAKVGAFLATSQELDDALYVFRLGSGDGVKTSSVQRQGAAEAVLRPKQLAALGLVKREPAEAQRYIEQQKMTGWMKGWLDVQEAKALAKLNENPALLEQRAREVYLQRQERYKHPTEASVTLILVDSYRRGFENATKRVEEVRTLLSGVSPERFEALAEELTDDPAVQSRTAQVTINVIPQQAEPPLRKVVFEQMKPGEVSGPHATNYGLVFVRLNSIKQAGVRPFEELKDALIEEIRTETAKKARVDAFAILTKEPVELIGQKVKNADRPRSGQAAPKVTSGSQKP